jgi:hypothetical protein
MGICLNNDTKSHFAFKCKKMRNKPIPVCCWPAKVLITNREYFILIFHLVKSMWKCEWSIGFNVVFWVGSVGVSVEKRTKVPTGKDCVTRCIKCSWEMKRKWNSLFDLSFALILKQLHKQAKSSNQSYKWKYESEETRIMYWVIRCRWKFVEIVFHFRRLLERLCQGCNSGNVVICKSLPIQSKSVNQMYWEGVLCIVMRSYHNLPEWTVDGITFRWILFIKKIGIVFNLLSDIP